MLPGFYSKLDYTEYYTPTYSWQNGEAGVVEQAAEFENVRNSWNYRESLGSMPYSPTCSVDVAGVSEQSLEQIIRAQVESTNKNQNQAVCCWETENTRAYSPTGSVGVASAGEKKSCVPGKPHYYSVTDDTMPYSPTDSLSCELVNHSVHVLQKKIPGNAEKKRTKILDSTKSDRSRPYTPTESVFSDVTSASTKGLLKSGKPEVSQKKQWKAACYLDSEAMPYTPSASVYDVNAKQSEQSWKKIVFGAVKQAEPKKKSDDTRPYSPTGSLAYSVNSKVNLQKNLVQQQAKQAEKKQRRAVNTLNREESKESGLKKMHGQAEKISLKRKHTRYMKTLITTEYSPSCASKNDETNQRKTELLKTKQVQMKKAAENQQKKPTNCMQSDLIKNIPENLKEALETKQTFRSTSTLNNCLKIGQDFSKHNWTTVENSMSIQKIAAIKAKRLANKQHIKQLKPSEAKQSIKRSPEPMSEKEAIAAQAMANELFVDYRKHLYESEKELTVVGEILKRVYDTEKGMLVPMCRPVKKKRQRKDDAKDSKQLPYNRYGQERFLKPTQEFGINTLGTNMDQPVRPVKKCTNRKRKHPELLNPDMPLSLSTLFRWKPIIVVPSAPTSLVTLYNVKQLLQEMRYVPSEQSREQLQQPLTKVIIERKYKNELQYYRVYDNVNRFTNEDWLCVVAVFMHGPLWQFKGWPWQANPINIFDKVCGFYLHMKGNKPHAEVEKFSVNVLTLPPLERHLDYGIMMGFWTKLEQHITLNKRFLGKRLKK